MPEPERRFTLIEARVEEHARVFEDLRRTIAGLDTRFDSVDRRFDTVDRRFEAVERRFETVDRRFERVERRLDLLDSKLTTHFMWLVGIQMTTLIAVVAALAGRR